MPGHGSQHCRAPCGTTHCGHQDIWVGHGGEMEADTTPERVGQRCIVLNAWAAADGARTLTARRRGSGAASRFLNGYTPLGHPLSERRGVIVCWGRGGTVSPVICATPAEMWTKAIDPHRIASRLVITPRWQAGLRVGLHLRSDGKPKQRCDDFAGNGSLRRAHYWLDFLMFE